LDDMAEGDKLFGRGRDLIQRQEYLESARNLACYLALRHRDLRPLQTTLMRRGLSSVGRSESRVVPTLDGLLTSLAAMLRVDDMDVPSYASEESFLMALRRSPDTPTRSLVQASTGGILGSW
jgi:pyruvate kinase